MVAFTTKCMKILRKISQMAVSNPILGTLRMPMKMRKWILRMKTTSTEGAKGAPKTPPVETISAASARKLICHTQLCTPIWRTNTSGPMGSRLPKLTRGEEEVDLRRQLQHQILLTSTTRLVLQLIIGSNTMQLKRLTSKLLRGKEGLCFLTQGFQIFTRSCTSSLRRKNLTRTPEKRKNLSNRIKLSTSSSQRREEGSQSLSTSKKFWMSRGKRSK